MTNVFEHIREHGPYRKFAIDELLFVEFKCIVEEIRFGMWSDANYFVFVTNGKKMWKTHRNDYMVHAGDALFVKKGANIAKQFHSEDYCALMIFMPDEFIKKFMLKFSDDLAYKKNETLLDSDGVLRINMDDFLVSYIKSLEVYFEAFKSPNSNVIRLKFEELLLNIFTSERHQEISSYLCNLNASNSTQLKQIMMDNYPYNLKLEEYAALANMSLSTFKRNFKCIFHESPGRWITNKKIKLATQFLKTSDKTISEIAYDCGFEDPSHFIKVFKKHENVTPLAYRKDVNS
ncbi:helix-turn-helix domain-containing protein [Algibacter mikhailovii]|uniref:helix-turn-helix domain-containing protein n=1 Tax=Algibacter mikhailovii TaxID=425498 RepID=UPI00249503DA|nr:AraC family transcriptional regulator [Algibacter mikhailovii]